MSVQSYRRRLIDDELDELMASLPAIALEGAKGVGKTATATQRASSIYQFDDPAQLEIARADASVVLGADPPVLIDEWQYEGAIWDRVRRAVDAGAAPGQFLLTGSASPKDAGSHSGGGRIASVRMRPLSLAERLDDPTTVSLTGLLRGERPAIAGKTTVALTDYVDEILRSGFPGIRHLTGRALRAQLDGYLQRIVDRDFAELGHQVRNPEALRRWMRAYAAAVSTTTSFEKIRDATTSGEDTVPAKTTVGPYRDVLERLFILDPVPSWQPSRSKIRELGFPSKHQLVDPALAAQLLGATKDALLKGQAPGPVIPRDGTLLGALFESLVTLSVRVYAQAAEAHVKHLRTHRGDREIDLIVQAPDGRVVAIEVKLSTVPPNDAVTHLKWLADRIGDELLDAVIITTGTEAYRRQDGIAVIPAGLLGV